MSRVVGVATEDCRGKNPKRRERDMASRISQRLIFKVSQRKN